MIKVFITGELGSIARALNKELPKQGLEVVWGISNRDENICTFISPRGVELDICNYQNLYNAIAITQPDIVVHTAAMVGTKSCNENPEMASIINIEGTANVIKVCQTFDIKLLYFSTTAVYKPVQNKEMFENSMILPQTVYGYTKSVGQYLVTNSNLSWNAVLPCFVYGSEFDTHSAISELVKSLKDNVKRDVLLDPSKKKDYLYIDDFVKAISMILNDWHSGYFYNISKGDPIPFGKVIDTIIKISGREPKYRLYPYKDYMGNHMVNSDFLKLRFGWEPKVSLNVGISEMIKCLA